MDLKLPSDLEGMYERFLKDLEAIEMQENDALSRAKLGIEISIDALGHLRSWFDDNPLPSEANEISFFKYIKPKFLCRLLFYQQVARIERRKPVAQLQPAIDSYYKRKNAGSLGTLRGCQGTLRLPF